MTAKGEVYQCDICGNVVQVMESGKGQLYCCGEPMKVREKIYAQGV